VRQAQTPLVSKDGRYRFFMSLMTRLGPKVKDRREPSCGEHTTWPLMSADHKRSLVVPLWLVVTEPLSRSIVSRTPPLSKSPARNGRCPDRAFFTTKETRLAEVSSGCPEWADQPVPVCTFWEFCFSMLLKRPDHDPLQWNTCAGPARPFQRAAVEARRFLVVTLTQDPPHKAKFVATAVRAT